MRAVGSAEKNRAAAEITELRNCLNRLSDERQARGRRYPLASIACLAVLALLDGARSLSEVKRWSEQHPAALLALDLKRCPCVATLSQLLRAVPLQTICHCLGTYAAAPLADRLETEPSDPLLHFRSLAMRRPPALDLAPGRREALTDAELAALLEWLNPACAEFPGLKPLLNRVTEPNGTLYHVFLGEEVPRGRPPKRPR